MCGKSVSPSVGELIWAWDLAPPFEVAGAEFAAETGYMLSTPNVWAPFAVDEERDLMRLEIGARVIQREPGADGPRRVVQGRDHQTHHDACVTPRDALRTPRCYAPRMDGYPVALEVPVAWGDVDAFGHVNNTIYFRWFESARMAHFERVGLPVDRPSR